MKRIIALSSLSALLLCLFLISNAAAAPYSGADIFRDGTDNSATYGSWWPGSETGSIQTNWESNWIEFEAYLYPGDWNIGLNVMNSGTAPEDYGEFRIEAQLFETATGWRVKKEALRITESSTEANYGFFSEDIKEGNHYTVRFTWLNDYFRPDLGYDANLLVCGAFFDDPSTTPPLEPPPPPDPPPTSVPEPSTLLLLGAGLLGIISLRRRSSNK